MGIYLPLHTEHSFTLIWYFPCTCNPSKRFKEAAWTSTKTWLSGSTSGFGASLLSCKGIEIRFEKISSKSKAPFPSTNMNGSPLREDHLKENLCRWCRLSFCSSLMYMKWRRTRSKEGDQVELAQIATRLKQVTFSAWEEDWIQNKNWM